ncbi:aquaporin NIP-type [Tripterygium wilfordii]|uniref:Aquaporin NIP-type n=1 Tax=Tripterygium wilfordii TaxID=458696 RepID=A0A7J7C412_TRIWF|nr:aquaporin NIP-type [Tripterygium wilfordii]
MTRKREEEEISEMELGNITITNAATRESDKANRNIGGCCSSTTVVTLAQKFIAIGTYFLIFAGCGSVAVNKIYGSVTFPGICVTWGLIVTVMVYTVGHVSGAHFNPAVTIALTIFRRFPYKEVPIYIVAQLIGSILASGTLILTLDVTPKDYFGTIPVGSSGQSLVMEIIATFLLMFVVSAVATDNRAVCIFSVSFYTIQLHNSLLKPISGASMNPARSIAPALLKHVYTGLWVYIVEPIVGAIAGAFAYNLIRSTDKTTPRLR